MTFMNRLQRLNANSTNSGAPRVPTMAFLGDSVTHGMFELTDRLTLDLESVYHAQLKRMLNELFPSCALNVINAGRSCEGAPQGLARLERDVISFQPDIAVVCFGLNDSHGRAEGLSAYRDALRGIFSKLAAADIQTIFMTPNMMCTYITPDIPNDYIQVANDCRDIQTDGTMDAYMDAARDVCREAGVCLCDCYAEWKKLSAAGVDTTSLLANHINHPSRKLHTLFAAMLLDALLSM